MPLVFLYVTDGNVDIWSMNFPKEKYPLKNHTVVEVQALYCRLWIVLKHVIKPQFEENIKILNKYHHGGSN